jgi:hypothetical protein
MWAVINKDSSVPHMFRRSRFNAFYAAERAKAYQAAGLPKWLTQSLLSVT